jgi:hypothetical protein
MPPIKLLMFGSVAPYGRSGVIELSQTARNAIPLRFRCCAPTKVHALMPVVCRFGRESPGRQQESAEFAARGNFCKLLLGRASETFGMFVLGLGCRVASN